MADRNRKITLKIEGDVSHLQRQLTEAEKSAKRLAASISKLSTGNAKLSIEPVLQKGWERRIEREISKLKSAEIKLNAAVQKIKLPTGAQPDIKVNATVNKVKFPARSTLNLTVDATVRRVKFPAQRDLDFKVRATVTSVKFPLIRDMNFRVHAQVTKVIFPAAKDTKLIVRKLEIVASEIIINGRSTNRNTGGGGGGNRSNGSRSSFANRVFQGSFLGSLAAEGVEGVVQRIEQIAVALGRAGVEAVRVAASFERTRNALTAISGSASIARTELASLEQLAKNTPGLGLVTAEEGFTRLQAVGFEAERSKDILTGLSKVKLLSGGTQQDLEALIYNLTQIKSIGKLTGDELRESLGRLPALGAVFQDAFGTVSSEAIGKLGLTSEQFFQKFEAALKRVKGAAGGFDDAFQKANDEFIKLQRAFGAPILAPLTRAFTDLGKLIEGNQKRFEQLGEYFGKIVTDFSNTLTNEQTTFADIGEKLGEIVGRGIADGITKAASDSINKLRAGDVGGILDNPAFFAQRSAFGGVKGLLSPAAESIDAFNNLIQKRNSGKAYGPEDLKDLEIINFFGAFDNEIKRLKTQIDKSKESLIATLDLANVEKTQPLGSAIGLIAGNIDIQKAITPDAVFDAEIKRLKKLQKDKDDAEAKAKVEDEKAIKRLDSQNREREAILTNRFKVEAAIRDSAVRNTTGDELAFLRRETAARKREFQIQINDTAQRYDQLIALNSRDKDEQLKLTNERNVAIGNLVTEQAVFEITKAKEIAAAERQIREERRQAAIEFKNLQIRESRSRTDRSTFSLDRAADSGDLSAFDRLEDETRRSLEEITRLTRENYTLQLQDRTLNAEQIVNIQKQLALEIQEIEEESARKLIDIDERRYNLQIQRLQTQSDRIQTILAEQSAAVESIAGFFDSANFNSKTFGTYQRIFLGLEAKRDLDKATARVAEGEARRTAGLAKNKEVTERALKLDFSPRVDLLKKESVDIDLINGQIEAYKLLEGAAKATFEDSQKDVRDYQIAIGKLGEELTTVIGAFRNFDKIAEKSFLEKQRIQLDSFNNGLVLNAQLLDAAKDKFKQQLIREVGAAGREQAIILGAGTPAAGSEDEKQLNRLSKEVEQKLSIFSKVDDALKRNSDGVVVFSNGVKVLDENLLKAFAATEQGGAALKNFLAGQEQANLDRYNNSLEGLTDRLNKLREGDAGTVNAVLDQSSKNFVREQNALYEEFIDLNFRLGKVGEDSAVRYQNAWTRATLEVREANIRAVESQIESQVRIADQANLHVEQLRAKVLGHLAEQKGVTDAFADGIIEAYEGVAGFLEKRLGKLGDIPVIGNLLKAGTRSALTSLTTGILDSIFPPEIAAALKPGTGNPVVDEQKVTNQKLDQIREAIGSVGSVTGGLTGGGIPVANRSGASGLAGGFLSIIQKLLNPRGGAGAYRTPSFNPNAANFFSGAGGSSSNPLTGLEEQFGFGANSSGGGGQARGPLGDFNSRFAGLGGGSEQGNLLQSLFGGGGRSAGGTGRGANLAAILTLGGQGLSALSGLTNGGAFGGLLSGAGRGLGIGAQIGSIIPGVGTLIGAGIGALIGGIVGLFTGNSARRRDERLRTQYLQESIAGLGQIDQLIRDVRALRVSPESAIESGTQIGASLRAQYLERANSLRDRKTREIAVRSVSELDYNIGVKLSQLRSAADVAGTAIDRRNRLLPEFAEGNFFAPKGRDDQFAEQAQLIDNRRGLIRGAKPGVDRHLGLFADDEMILNARHRREIIAGAGEDVFAKYTQIPNYPKYAEGVYFAPTVAPKIATPKLRPTEQAAVGDIYVNITMEGEIEKVKIKSIALEGLQEEKGHRVIANVISTGKTRGTIK